MKKVLNRVALGIGIVLLLVTSSCQAKVISQTSQKLERYAATIKDFPKGWAFVSEDWGVDGKESYSATYGVPNKDFIGFGETIVIYPDQTQAQNAYLEQEKEWFSVGEKWTGTEFIPLNLNDKYRYECLQIPPNTSIISCTFLQTHNELVVIILVNVDGEAMTLSQFNKILRVLDERLNKTTLD